MVSSPSLSHNCIPMSKLQQLNIKSYTQYVRVFRCESITSGLLTALLIVQSQVFGLFYVRFVLFFFNLLFAYLCNGKKKSRIQGTDII